MKKSSIEDKFVNTFSYSFLILFAVFCAVPFLLTIMSSITDEVTLYKYGYSLFPKKFSFYAYNLLFSTSRIPTAYLVTTAMTIFGTLASMLCTCAMSYAISVKTLKYRNKIAFYAYFTMLFSGGLVASYILITRYLHLNNNFLVYIIPSLVNPWNMFLLRNFFATVPDSLAESAKIDGANDVTILFKIILPVSKPALATVSLFYALAYWNDWFRSLMYMDNKALHTLQYIVMAMMRDQDFISQLASVENVTVQYVPPLYTTRMATTIATIGPIIFLYPFLQKYFIKGLLIGAVKG